MKDEEFYWVKHVSKKTNSVGISVSEVLKATSVEPVPNGIVGLNLGTKQKVPFPNFVPKYHCARFQQQFSSKFGIANCNAVKTTQKHRIFNCLFVALKHPWMLVLVWALLWSKCYFFICIFRLCKLPPTGGIDWNIPPPGPYDPNW